MIRNTHETNSDGVLSAYKDNAAVLRGYKSKRFYPDSSSVYKTKEEDIHVVTKVEKERRLKAAQKETKVAKTISIPISYWALLDQVRNKLGKKNANETIMYCIKEIAIGEGLES